MEGRGAARADRICGALCAAIGGRMLPVRLHSRFRSAANLETELGLVTLLAPGKCLQPYAVGLKEEMDFCALERGVLALSPSGLTRNGVLVVTWAGAPAVDLRKKQGGVPKPCMARAVRRFLTAGPSEGLSRLALGRTDGPYAALVAPRLAVLRRAVRSGDPAAAAAARRMAGCGPGLTPSSDDLLCGYLALLPAREPWEALAAAIASAAAGGTNDISAALLTRAGEGYFSEDVLTLLDCLQRGAAGQALTAALLRVARFGSSSGYDFLTGVYFGLVDACAIGGIGIG